MGDDLEPLSEDPLQLICRFACLVYFRSRYGRNVYGHREADLIDIKPRSPDHLTGGRVRTDWSLREAERLLVQAIVLASLHGQLGVRSAGRY